MSDLETRMRAIVTEQLGVDDSQVTNEAKMIDDLGADSLDIVELIMSAEDEFEVRVTDDEDEAIYRGTFGDFCNLVGGKLLAQAEG